MAESNKLKRQIHALDFALLEMEMFLDTRPNDERALKVREQYQNRRNALIEEYERLCGPYIVTSGDVRNTNHWTWIDNPWPWDYTGEMR